MAGRFTKLQAVNRMLRAAGEHPVNSLSDDGVNDTRVAEDLLDEVSKMVQTPGLHCNTVIKTYTANTSNIITLPSALLEVDSWDEHDDRDVCERDGNLYDLTNDTDQFTSANYTSIKLRLVVELDFVSLPAALQFQIVDLAAMVYQKQTVGDDSMDDSLATIASISRGLGRAANMRTRDANLFKGTSKTARQAGLRDRNYW